MSIPIFYLKNANFSIADKILFEDIGFEIYPNDKICLIGKNGCGKSTLLKLINQDIQFDSGEIFMHPAIKIGYLPQEISVNNHETVYDYVLDAKVQNELEQPQKYQADIILSQLELEGSAHLSKLSGGNLRRAALVKALLQKPDILLLDEPTNHLDIKSIEWLQNYFKYYEGAIICISHDRAFLREISSKIFWLDRGTMRVHNKGYNYFDEWQESVYEQEMKELVKLNRKLDEENIWLQQGVTARRKRNQKRLSNLFSLREKLKQQKQQYNSTKIQVNLPEIDLRMSAKIVLELNNVSLSYNNSVLFKPFSMRIMRGEKIGIIGANGSGKTSFLKLITKQIEPTQGRVKLGKNIRISYIDQLRKEIKPNETLWQNLCPEGGDRVNVGGKMKHVVAHLKDFMFTSKQARDYAGNLSGGEQNRLLLAKILADPGDLLILDEPTNDLDMDSLDLLQEYLSDYKGTLIVVSHDRDFLDKLVTRTLIFKNKGEIEDHIGGFTDATQEDIKIVKANTSKNVAKVVIPEATSKPKLSYKHKFALENLPNEINELEEEIAYLSQKLADDPELQSNMDEYVETIKLLEEKNNSLTMKEEEYLALIELEERSK